MKEVLKYLLMRITIIGLVMAFFWGYYMNNFNQSYVETLYPLRVLETNEIENINDAEYIYDSIEESARENDIEDYIEDYTEIVIDGKTYILRYDERQKYGSLYLIDKKNDKYTNPLFRMMVYGWGMEIFYDGGSYENDIAFLITEQCARFNYLVNENDEDVYMGFWCGNPEPLTQLMFGKGEFSYEYYSKLSDGTDIYLWKYTLKDSRELLSPLWKYTDEPSHKGEKIATYRILDLKNALEVTTKNPVDYRGYIFAIIIGAMIIVSIVLDVIRLIMRKRNSDKKRLMIVLNVFACVLLALSVFSILYFIYNPQLNFGSYYGFNSLLRKLTGKTIPDQHFYKVLKY